MIVVDSSVWIAHLRDEVSTQVTTLRAIRPTLIVMGDVILLEVLRGLGSEREAEVLGRKFAAYGVVSMLDHDLAAIGAANYRALRRLGVTVRTVPDIIIATYCIEHGQELLHQDRDFDHFERHLGLHVVR
ncbi:MAG: PIN domain-containing protein [Devosia sp.]